MNPDGFSLKKRGNANNIDLNRDFPDQVYIYIYILIVICIKYVDKVGLRLWRMLYSSAGHGLRIWKKDLIPHSISV